MNKNNRSPDFNLFLSSDITFGTLEALNEKMADIPTVEPERTEWINAVAGLVSAGLKAAREMNAFLYEASDRHYFPNTYSDIEPDFEGVKEPTLIYAFSRSGDVVC